MLSFDEARARILAEAPRLGAEDVPLETSLGRVLAEDVTATAPLPPFDYSAMDGYALRATGAASSASVPFRPSTSNCA